MSYSLQSTFDKTYGALLGHACGDCLGAPAEFLSPEEVRAQYPQGLRDLVGGGVFDWRPGQGTDDTDLNLIALDAYQEGGLDLNDHLVAQKLIAWAVTNPPDIGLTTRGSLRRLRAGTEPSKAGDTRQHDSGNGSLMRALAPGLVHASDQWRRHRDAKMLSQVTHAAPDAIAACTAYADIVAALLLGTDPAQAIAAVDCELTSSVARALDVIAEPTWADSSGWVVTGLALAVRGLLDSATASPEEVLIQIVARGGDADTNAAIAGGLLGAAHGYTCFPLRWTRVLEHLQRIQDHTTWISQLSSKQ